MTGTFLLDTAPTQSKHAEARFCVEHLIFHIRHLAEFLGPGLFDNVKSTGNLDLIEEKTVKLAIFTAKFMEPELRMSIRMCVSHLVKSNIYTVVSAQCDQNSKFNRVACQIVFIVVGCRISRLYISSSFGDASCRLSQN
jgi:hypothetical protein